MSKFNYKKISQGLLQDLPQRTQAIISRRFGFEKGNKETLDAIGRDYGITRERVRQIENFGMEKARENAKSLSPNAFQYFSQQINAFGGFKKEESLLQELGGSDFKPYVLFLLNVDNQFKRFSEKDDFFPAWAMEAKPIKQAHKTAMSFIKELEKRNKPFMLEDSKTYKANRARAKAILASVELSKRILKNSDGLCGFATWPEINPKGIKDKAFLALKKENKPMHFTDVADLIQANEKYKKPYLFKTVHNELIKDNRFVLVGRGLYGLLEWGYRHTREGRVFISKFFSLRCNDKFEKGVTDCVLLFSRILYSLFSFYSLIGWLGIRI